MEDVTPTPTLLARRPLRIGLLILLAAAAIGVRLPGLFGPALELKPSRQYRTALIARALHLEHQAEEPPWRREVAAEVRRSEGTLEPPILEHLAGLLYAVSGSESLWLPRLFNALVWVLAGFLLYDLAARWTSAEGGLFAAAFYWFLPFTVPASRAFQADPLMVALTVASLHALWRHHENPASRRVVAAALLSGAAAFVKPVALFFLGPVWIALAVRRDGWRRGILGSPTWIFAALLLAPSLAWLGWQLLEGGRMEGQVRGSFQPGLLTRVATYRGWMRLMGEVAGYVAVAGAVVGATLLRRRGTRAALAGLALGYGVYGALFAYHIHTHNYYHLPLVPVVALGLAPVGAALFAALARAGVARTAQVALVAVAVGLAASVTRSTYPSPWALARVVDRAHEVGAAVEHSHRTVFLAPFLGKPLLYHGEIAGQRWPSRSTLREDQIRGEAIPTVSARLNRLLEARPEYFVVTDLRELDAQPELRELLERRFPVCAQELDFLVFDLRE